MTQPRMSQEDTAAAIDEFSSALVDVFPGVAGEKSKRLRAAMSGMLAAMWAEQVESMLPFAARVQVLDGRLSELGDRFADMRVLVSELRERAAALEEDYKSLRGRLDRLEGESIP